ncbi:hypothetical protein ACFODZ_17090 [Marinicella sediminis]|uniref:DUF7919 domain-containing protein n=1 Tax=Marinicella sediminis TaxID=1792834 RepID=A0ABV7JDB3_9GAMM|nr:hypothetical protein [Marinicella sediminis]
MYIKDLEQCDFLPIKEDFILAVGWLDKNYDFNKGSVSIEFYKKLKELCNNPWQPFVSAGMHKCNICQFDGPVFNSNIYLPENDKIYVSPVAILHYINCHHYSPPNEYVNAVLNCPDISSMEYKKKLLSNGGGVLLKGR